MMCSSTIFPTRMAVFSSISGARPSLSARTSAAEPYFDRPLIFGPSVAFTYSLRSFSQASRSAGL